MCKKNVVMLSTFLLIGAAMPLSVQTGAGQGADHAADSGGQAYHDQLPPGPLPSTLNPSQFQDNRAAFVTYTLAARIPKILYQEPCFCPCHEKEGHQSLLDCFAGTHGLSCHLCKQEVIYCYEQQRAGKSTQVIRMGLMKREWREVDVNKYVQSLPASWH